MTSIHISDIRTFRSCRRKWQWSSGLQMNLEPVIPYVPFFTGKALHAALEFYYRDGVPLDQTVDKYLLSEKENMERVDDLWPAEKTSFEEQIDLIRDMIYHYSLWQAQDERKYADKNLEFISLEQGFEIPLPLPDFVGEHPDATLGGRFDGIVKHKGTGQYWIWETKTTRSATELTRSLVNDEQCGVYMYAASKMLGVPVVGVLYNILRKKTPTEPKMLQNGSLSQARSIDTTAFHYLSTIRSCFPDWSKETIEQEYGEMLASLLPNEDKFFLRYPVHRSDVEIKMLMTNVYHTAIEMMNPQLALYPAPNWLNCNFCQFRSPCLAMNAGGNYRVLLEEEYQHRESATSMRLEEGEVCEIT